MRKNRKGLLLFLALVSATSFVFPHYGCSLFGKDASNLQSDTITAGEREICPALDVANAQEFLDNGNSADFFQLDNDQTVFIFISSDVAESFDGQNVIELKKAVVDFDYEDESVDTGDLGGFWARWKLVFVPYTDARFNQFQNGSATSTLSQFVAAADRIETQLSGPFLQNGCEWGDTDEIGVQSITYSNYPLYDWDFFPGTDRILGLLYEGDDGIGDDPIAKLDISKGDGDIVIEQTGRYHLELTTLSNVLMAP